MKSKLPVFVVVEASDSAGINLKQSLLLCYGPDVESRDGSPNLKPGESSHTCQGAVRDDIE